MALKKRKSKIFLDPFPFDIIQEEKAKLGQKADAGQLEETGSPDEVLRLIMNCEKLLATLKVVGADDVVNAVLHDLAKLKRILLGLFKKKQRKLVDIHWEQMRKEEDDRSKKTEEQLERYRKMYINQPVMTKKEG